MPDAAYLRKILEERYGIKTDSELNEAIRKMARPDLGAMTSAPTTNNHKEATICA